MNNLIKQSSIIFLVLATSLLWFSTSMAKGPPEKVTVTAADPDFALQGDSPDVVISGSGFGHGSRVKFLVTGTKDASQIDVGTVVYDESSGDLVASIHVLDTAPVVDYDIEVRTLSGRRGKGTTLFAVRKKDDGEFHAVPVTAGYIFDDGTTSKDMEEADPYPTTTPGWENWSENTLSVIPRPCSGESISQYGNPATAGRYFCMQEEATGGRISIDLVGTGLVWEDITPGKKQKYPGFCKLLNVWGEFSADPLEFGATWYAINFNDGCTDVQCPIRITTQSYSGPTNDFGVVELHPFHDLTGLGYLGMEDNNGNPITELPDVGPLGVVAEMDGTLSVDFPADPELNIFTVPQALAVGQFRIEFKKITAPSGAMAVCQTTAVNNIWFVTEPQ